MSAAPGRRSPTGDRPDAGDPTSTDDRARSQTDLSALTVRRIVFIGFMGAGKSTVGRMLAARLGWRFFDTDVLIAAQQHLTVAEIFARFGEAHFRKLEIQAIHTALQQTEVVIALGGGAIESDPVRDLLFIADSRDPLTIYLEAPLHELLARCKGGSATHVRPLLAAAEPPQERLERRLPHYRRAHLTVPTAGLSPDAVVAGILALLPTTTLHTGATIPGKNGTA